jgi:hypothetical protein
LADGVVVLVDRSDRSLAIRLDDDGKELWQVELPGISSSDPVRTHDFVAVPIDGDRVVVIDIRYGRIHGPSIGVPGATLHGGIAALGGRVWMRMSKTTDGLGPFLAVTDLSNLDSGAHLHEDPFGDAIETRYRRTANTIVVAAEHPDGDATLVGLDERNAKVLWRHDLHQTGVIDLWAAGGLVDLVISDGVRSWEARTGRALTHRFDGRVLEGARLAGETLLVLVYNPAQGRGVQAYNAATEESVGELKDIVRILGASSDHALLRRTDGSPLLVELPNLKLLSIHDAEAIEDAELVAFSRHAVWVVAHGGRSLTCLEPPE